MAPVSSAFRTLLALGLACCASNAGEATGDLAFTIVEPCVAAFPIEFALTVVSTGARPITYWCGGPGSYPSAKCFSVTATGSDGTVIALPLHNGQYEFGSGIGHSIDDEATFPAACDPLPVGDWTLSIASTREWHVRDRVEVTTWPAMQSSARSITVLDDAGVRAERERWLLIAKAHDVFKEHLAVAYGLDPVVMEWLRSLSGDEPMIGALNNRVIRLPPGAGAMLVDAATAQVARERTNANDNHLSYLSKIAAKSDDDENLEAVLIIARADGQIGRFQAISELARFPQARAKEALVAFASDPGGDAYWQAIAALACCGDRSAVEPLLQRLKGGNPGVRMWAVMSLAGLRDESRVRDTLQAALTDDDAGVQFQARLALSTPAKP